MIDTYSKRLLIGSGFANGDENTIKMNTIILLLAIIVFCWLFFKSINWFEKI